MKTIFLGLAISVIMAGCATGPTAYGPAQGSGLGFAEQQIEADRFQIRFTGRNADEARNLALLRAAEITLAHDYEHFRVVGAGTQGDFGRGSPITTSVGLGVGSGGFRRGGGTSLGVGIGINDLGRLLAGDKTTASMEIILGKGERADADNVYDARSIVETLGTPAN